jgi:hypothetical protein
MNEKSDLMRQRHSVKVNKGSGVLIQPMSPDYAYVLTAKHCLRVDSENLDSAEVQPHVVSACDGTEITILDVICHDNEDMAILIVVSDSTLELMINCDSLKTNDNAFLCGYPEDRREMDDEYSALIYMYSHKANNRLILTPKTAGVGRDNVVGFSGGGIFTLCDNVQPVLLCAIETKMDGNIAREHRGAISAIPISEFEIFISDPLTQYLDQPLAPLLPLHLSSFEHLIDFSFDISKSWTIDRRLNFLIDRLKEFASEDIQVNLYPYDILVNFEDSLKVHSRPEHELHRREFWVALLELLTISILIDKPEIIDITYVEKIFKLRRLVFIGVNDTWQEHITDIFKAELNDFEEGGVIVAKTLSSQREVKFSQERVKKLIDNKHIARPLGDLRSITNSKTNISKINSIVDLSALHAECIEIKECLYEDLTDATDFDAEKLLELRLVLAREYSTYLTIEGNSDEW